MVVLHVILVVIDKNTKIDMAIVENHVTGYNKIVAMVNLYSEAMGNIVEIIKISMQ